METKECPRRNRRKLRARSKIIIAFLMGMVVDSAFRSGVYSISQKSDALSISNEEFVVESVTPDTSLSEENSITLETTAVTKTVTIADTMQVTTEETLVEDTTQVSIVTTPIEVTTIETADITTITKKETTIVSTVNETTVHENEIIESRTWTDDVLNSQNGTVVGPSGKETWYNLDMSGVISIMKQQGFDSKYWIREDGVKMYGEYIMCAANLETRPRGTILETSLGLAIVCDTGAFVYGNSNQIDIAVNW